MSMQTGNLSKLERALSALLGTGLSTIALGRGNPALRAVAAVASAGLLARAAAGHCAVKALAQGHSSLTQGVSDQLRGLGGHHSARNDGLPGSPRHSAKSRAVDESSDESFPASDAPASHLPDEPPSNAEAKWAAARKAGALDPNH